MMKKYIIIIIGLLVFLAINSKGQVFTPTGDSIFATSPDEEYSAPQIAAADLIWKDSIIDAGWAADFLSSCATTYNCHGYAWHMSDGGDTVWMPNIYDVAKYYGTNPTYRKIDGPKKYAIVYYNGAQHSGIVDPENTDYVISKWGPGPLVSHLPHHCPYYDQYTYTLEYYELIIDETPSSVAENCATNVNTLNISNATYNWSGDGTYVCAAGSTYTGSVTGLEETTGNGEVKVELYSPHSQTTVKGIKSFSVTSSPSAPSISSSSALVCSGGETFTLNNVPDGNTITWKCSSNLSISDIHANPCTISSTGNGSGWVDAIVSTDCVDSTLSVARYNVWSGKPVFVLM